MRGRYGRFDQINKALLVLWAIMMILDRWIPYYIGNILAVAAFALVLYRFLSKKIYPRSNENQKFIQWIAQMKDVFKGKKLPIAILSAQSANRKCVLQKDEEKSK